MSDEGTRGMGNRMKPFPNAKLTWWAVGKIRKQRKEPGMTLEILSIRWGVGKSVISRIVNGITWKPHLEEKHHERVRVPRVPAHEETVGGPA